jgi:threonine synthase
MTEIVCRNCSKPYPKTGLPHQCPNCGGVFTLRDLTFTKPALVSAKTQGIWKFRESFGLPASYPASYLGEGNTPLVPVKILGTKFWAKMENLNPSGSFKDRATAVLTSVLRGRGLENVIEDSSGNAGGSLALYASAFGIHTRIYIPSGTSGPKRRQIEVCGAEVILVDGPRENAHKAALEAVRREGLPYASHAAQPFGMAGIATIAYEIFETLGEMPGTVFCPIGHGSLFTGVLMGFDALLQAGLASRRPRMIGVQPEVCAPIVSAWHGKPFAGGKGSSLAEGTMVESPARMEEILGYLEPGTDQLVTVTELEIAEAHRLLIQAGLYVEPTSAMVLAASRNVKKTFGKSVLILSGSGLKSKM